MMKAVLLLVLALGSVGCGGSSPSDALEGSWALQQSNGCALINTFTSPNYALGQICPLTNGDFGFDIESGTFSASASQVTYTPTKASCHAHSHTAETD